MLHVASNRPQVLGPLPEPSADFSTYQRTQLAMVKSRFVLNAALREKAGKQAMLRNKDNPVDWLEKELKADYAIAPEVLRISLKGDDPDELLTMVSAVVQAYLKEIVHKEKTRRNHHLEQLEDLFAKFDQSLKRKREMLAALAKRAGAKDSQVLALRHQFAMKRLNMEQENLAKLKSELLGKEARLRTLEAEVQAKAQTAVPQSVLDRHVDNDPVVADQQSRLTILEKEIERHRARLNPRNAEAHLKRMGLTSELAAARAALAKLRDKVRPEIARQLRERLTREDEARIAQLKREIAILKDHEAILDGLVERWTKETRDINETSVDLESVKGEIQQTEEMASRVGRQMDALKVELLAPERITLLEEPFVTATQDEKKQIILTGLAALGLFCLVVMGIGYQEFRARRIGTAEEVVQGLGLRLLGSLPVLPNQRTPRLLAGDSARQQHQVKILTESIDATRTMLLHAARTDSKRVVMVTSALGGEGKTSLAGHLAASLARAGYRTLLADGDLRRPALHRLFDVPLDPGFNELLRGEVHLAEVIRTTMADRLWVIPGGRWDDGVSQVLAQGDVAGIFQQLKTNYDFVVVDSSPALLVADSLLIAQRVDAVLFSVLRDVSLLPAVYSAYQKFTALGVPILGAVANGTQSPVYASDYQYYAAPAVVK
jgi:capsular exopolysaccharide synthesis family protein